MAVRTIIEKEDSFLRRKARKIDKIDDRIIILLEDMAETMYEANGVGLAAPQVSVGRRVVVIDVGEGIIELINPEILESEGTQRNLEGCLSVPGESGYVDRPMRVKVKALNRDGEEVTYDAEGYLAIAMCHEIDHLDGVLFIDKVLDLSEEEIEELRRRDAEKMIRVEEDDETNETPEEEA